MNCVNHPDTVASGTCNFCGKALCVECVNRFSPPGCATCSLSNNSDIAKQLLFDIGLTLFLFVGVAILTFYYQPNAKIDAPILFGLFVSCAYWGWQFLSQFSGDHTVVYIRRDDPHISTIVVKLILSVCIGIIAMPWQIFTRVRTLRQINALKKDIEEGRA